MPAFAEDSLKTILDRVVKFESEGQIKKALEELSWAQNTLQEANKKKIAELLPKQIGEFVGGEVESNDVMGMSATEREYSAGEMTIKLSLLGSAASADKGGSNPFAAIGQIAMMGAGMDPSARKTRMNGRTTTIKQEAGSDQIEMMISLKNGSTVRLEANGMTDAKKFEEMVQGVDLNPLENYLS
jgi:hypothetical protein